MRVVKIHTKNISNEDLREIQDQIDEILGMDIYNMGPSGPKKIFSSKKREREPENIKKGETENIQEQIEKIKDELSGVKDDMSLKENQIIKPKTKTMERRDTGLELKKMLQKNAEKKELLNKTIKKRLSDLRGVKKNEMEEKYKSQIDECNERLGICESKNKELARQNDLNKDLGNKLKECTDELTLLKNENLGIKSDISQLQSDKLSCEDNIKKLEEAKSSYEAKIKEMDNLNLYLKNKLTQLENKNVDIKMYKDQIDKLGNDKKEYENKISNFSKTNLGLKAKLSQYENSLKIVTKERDDIKKNIDSLTITANTYKQQINDANKKIEDYKNSILFNQKQNENLQQLLDEKIGENNEKIDQLTQQIAADKKEIGELNKELDRYESETRQLDSMVKDLQQKNKEITENNTKYVDKIKSFQEQIEQLTNQNAELLRQQSDNGNLYNQYKDETEQKINKLNETNQQLRTKLNAIESERNNLLEQYEDLKKKHDELTRNNTNLINEINEIKNKKDEYTGNLEKIKKEKNECTEKLTQIEKEKNKCTEDLKKIEKKKNEYKQKLEDCNKKISDYSKSTNGLLKDCEEYSTKMTNDLKFCRQSVNLLCVYPKVLCTIAKIIEKIYFFYINHCNVEYIYDYFNLISSIFKNIGSIPTKIGDIMEDIRKDYELHIGGDNALKSRLKPPQNINSDKKYIEYMKEKRKVDSLTRMNENFKKVREEKIKIVQELQKNLKNECNVDDIATLIKNNNSEIVKSVGYLSSNMKQKYALSVDPSSVNAAPSVSESIYSNEIYTKPSNLLDDYSKFKYVPKTEYIQFHDEKKIIGYKLEIDTRTTMPNNTEPFYKHFNGFAASKRKIIREQIDPQIEILSSSLSRKARDKKDDKSIKTGKKDDKSIKAGKKDDKSIKAGTSGSTDKSKASIQELKKQRFDLITTIFGRNDNENQKKVADEYYKKNKHKIDNADITYKTTSIEFNNFMISGDKLLGDNDRFILTTLRNAVGKHGNININLVNYVSKKFRLLASYKKYFSALQSTIQGSQNVPNSYGIVSIASKINQKLSAIPSPFLELLKSDNKIYKEVGDVIGKIDNTKEIPNLARVPNTSTDFNNLLREDTRNMHLSIYTIIQKVSYLFGNLWYIATHGKESMMQSMSVPTLSVKSKEKEKEKKKEVKAAVEMDSMSEYLRERLNEIKYTPIGESVFSKVFSNIVCAMYKNYKDVKADNISICSFTSFNKNFVVPDKFLDFVLKFIYVYYAISKKANKYIEQSTEFLKHHLNFGKISNRMEVEDDPFNDNNPIINKRTDHFIENFHRDGTLDVIRDFDLTDEATVRSYSAETKENLFLTSFLDCIIKDGDAFILDGKKKKDEQYDLKMDEMLESYGVELPKAGSKETKEPSKSKSKDDNKKEDKRLELIKQDVDILLSHMNWYKTGLLADKLDILGHFFYIMNLSKDDNQIAVLDQEKLAKFLASFFKNIKKIMTSILSIHTAVNECVNSMKKDKSVMYSTNQALINWLQDWMSPDCDRIYTSTYTKLNELVLKLPNIIDKQEELKKILGVADQTLENFPDDTFDIIEQNLSYGEQMMMYIRTFVLSQRNKIENRNRIYEENFFANLFANRVHAKQSDGSPKHFNSDFYIAMFAFFFYNVFGIIHKLVKNIETTNSALGVYLNKNTNKSKTLDFLLENIASISKNINIESIEKIVNIENWKKDIRTHMNVDKNASEIKIDSLRSSIRPPGALQFSKSFTVDNANSELGTLLIQLYHFSDQVQNWNKYIEQLFKTNSEITNKEATLTEEANALLAKYDTLFGKLDLDKAGHLTYLNEAIKILKVNYEVDQLCNTQQLTFKKYAELWKNKYLEHEKNLYSKNPYKKKSAHLKEKPTEYNKINVDFNAFYPRQDYDFDEGLDDDIQINKDTDFVLFVKSYVKMWRYIYASLFVSNIKAPILYANSSDKPENIEKKPEPKPDHVVIGETKFLSLRNELQKKCLSFLYLDDVKNLGKKMKVDKEVVFKDLEAAMNEAIIDFYKISDSRLVEVAEQRLTKVYKRCKDFLNTMHTSYNEICGKLEERCIQVEREYKNDQTVYEMGILNHLQFYPFEFIDSSVVVSDMNNILNNSFYIINKANSDFAFYKKIQDDHRNFLSTIDYLYPKSKLVERYPKLLLYLPETMEKLSPLLNFVEYNMNKNVKIDIDLIRNNDEIFGIVDDTDKHKFLPSSKGYSKQEYERKRNELNKKKSAKLSEFAVQCFESLVYVRKMLSFAKRPVVIDGSNVAVARNYSKQVKELQGRLTYYFEDVFDMYFFFAALGHPTYVVIHKNFMRREYFSKKNEPIIVTDSRKFLVINLYHMFPKSMAFAEGYEDRLVLAIANYTGGIVISNDNFEDPPENLGVESPELVKSKKYLDDILSFSISKDQLKEDVNLYGDYRPVLSAIKKNKQKGSALEDTFGSDAYDKGYGKFMPYALVQIGPGRFATTKELIGRKDIFDDAKHNSLFKEFFDNL